MRPIDRPPASPHGRAPWFRHAEAASLGIEIAVAITVGAVGGFYLEKYVTHWSPWTMLLGLAAGIAAAVKAILRTITDFKTRIAHDADPRK